MNENKNRLTASHGIHTVNNHLMVVIALTHLLDERLNLSGEVDAEAIQMVSRIREAAGDAATITQSIRSNDGVLSI